MVGGCGYSFWLFMVQLFRFRCLPVGFLFYLGHIPVACVTPLLPVINPMNFSPVERWGADPA
jgi:hypothetical protein